MSPLDGCTGGRSGRAGGEGKSGLQNDAGPSWSGLLAAGIKSGTEVLRCCWHEPSSAEGVGCEGKVFLRVGSCFSFSLILAHSLDSDQESLGRLHSNIILLDFLWKTPP